MNKTLQEIINEIIELKEGNATLLNLNSTSKTSLWRQIVNVIAFVLFNFQKAALLHQKEIEEKIATQKMPTAKWYREQALRFQYGFAIDPDSLSAEFLPTYQDSSGNTIVATDQMIEASKIIKYASVTPNLDTMGVKRISMKIAGENADEVLSNEKALAFRSYIEEINAIGDNIVIVNFLPDILLLQYKICVDPKIILPDGMNILTGEYPVKAAIQNFLLNLPFNGELSTEALENAIQQVNGVIDLEKLNVSTKWIQPGIGYGTFQPVVISRIPKSGRYKIEDWSGLTYIYHEPEQ